VILRLSRMSMSSLRLLGTLGLSRKYSFVTHRAPTSCPTCVSNIFIMMNTSRIEFSTSVTLPSKCSNTFSIASNLVTASLLILACSSMKSFNCVQRGTKSWMDELALFGVYLGHGRTPHTPRMWIMPRQPLGLELLSLSQSSPSSS
jgi:hypothetical protein